MTELFVRRGLKEVPDDMEKNIKVYFIIRVYAKIISSNGFGSSMETK
jgi:hypothetical protein